MDSCPNECFRPGSPCHCFLKIFLFLLIIGPMLIPFFILLSFGIIANILIMIYFVLFGWLCEIEIVGCHGKFLSESLSKPWYPLKSFLEALCKFCDMDFCTKK